MPSLPPASGNAKRPASPSAKRPAPKDVDSTRWTGDVDEQRAEAKGCLVGIVVVLALAVPLAVWIGRAISTAMGY
jgi:hypothetical protein